MQSLDALSKEAVTRLRGFLFDLDDTLLEHGRLLPEALSALYRLHEAGLELFAVTGRPAGWGAVVAHQWPIDGAVTENGAVALRRDGKRVVLDDPLGAAGRRERRAQLDAIVSALCSEYPELVPSDDAWQRVSDFTFDIGEHQRVPSEVVTRVKRSARELGATTIASSVHLHVTLDRADKASGSVRLLGELYKLDPFRALSAYAFIGDSENDAACFGAFRLTLGVRNLSGRPTIAPRFRTQGERSRGFVEAADLLLARRTELR
jgi:HAD superfamily hydrolase (TIGR01484 family)